MTRRYSQRETGKHFGRTLDPTGAFRYGEALYMKPGKLTRVFEAVKAGLVVYTLQTVVWGPNDDFHYIDAPGYSEHNGEASTLAQIMTAAGLGYRPATFRKFDGFFKTGWVFQESDPDIEACALAAGYLEQLDAWDILDKFSNDRDGRDGRDESAPTNASDQRERKHSPER